jgi:hypothetical protein
LGIVTLKFPTNSKASGRKCEGSANEAIDMRSSIFWGRTVAIQKGRVSSMEAHSSSQQQLKPTTIQHDNSSLNLNKTLTLFSKTTKMKFFTTALLSAAAVSGYAVYEVKDFTASCVPHSTFCKSVLSLLPIQKTTANIIFPAMSSR